MPIRYITNQQYLSCFLRTGQVFCRRLSLVPPLLPTESHCVPIAILTHHTLLMMNIMIQLCPSGWLIYPAARLLVLYHLPWFTIPPTPPPYPPPHPPTYTHTPNGLWHGTQASGNSLLNMWMRMLVCVGRPVDWIVQFNSKQLYLIKITVHTCYDYCTKIDEYKLQHKLLLTG